MDQGSRPLRNNSISLSGFRLFLSRFLEIPVWISERMTGIGEIFSRYFKLLCEIGRILFRFSQILRGIRERPHRISEIRDVSRHETSVIAQEQERISQIREVIL